MTATTQETTYPVEKVTTDATLTRLWSRKVWNGEVVHLRLVLVGIQRGGTNKIRLVRECTFTAASGTAEQLGDNWAPVPDVKTDSTWGGITVGVTTDTAYVSVTGKVATTIDWTLLPELLAG